MYLSEKHHVKIHTKTTICVYNLKKIALESSTNGLSKTTADWIVHRQWYIHFYSPGVTTETILRHWSYTISRGRDQVFVPIIT